MNNGMEKVSKQKMNTLPKIVAIDFDGTLVEDQFPEIGNPIPGMFDLVRQLQNEGIKVILWTCRDHERLEEAVFYCETAQGIVFDSVNENIAEVRFMFNNDTRKVYADLYIDDKSIPHMMSPSFWAERLGLQYTLTRGIHNGS